MRLAFQGTEWPRCGHDRRIGTTIRGWGSPFMDHPSRVVVFCVRVVRDVRSKMCASHPGVVFAGLWCPSCCAGDVSAGVSAVAPLVSLLVSQRCPPVQTRPVSRLWPR